MGEEFLSGGVVAKPEIGDGRLSAVSIPAIKSQSSIGEWTTRQSNSGTASFELSSPIRTNSAAKHELNSQRNRMRRGTEYQPYREICEALILEASQAQRFLVGDDLNDDGAEVVVEIEQLLDRLYRCDWGAHECLKRVVVAIRSQVGNVQWKRNHVAFLEDTAALLRNSYVLDEAVVRECYDLIREHGLEVFRGGIAETEVRRKYRIVEIE